MKIIVLSFQMYKNKMKKQIIINSPELYLRHVKSRPRSPNAVYIGRPSFWGNPYRVEEYGRAGAIMKFETYLLSSGLYKNLENLRNLEIICHCFPLPCHGDVISKHLYRK